MDTTPSVESARQTIKDKKSDCTLYLREFAPRLNDVCLKLSHTAEIFPNRTALSQVQNARGASVFSVESKEVPIPFFEFGDPHNFVYSVQWLSV